MISLPKALLALLAAVLLACSVAYAHAADTAGVAPVNGPGETLAAIRKAGTVTCGVVIDEDDYSEGPIRTAICPDSALTIAGRWPPRSLPTPGAPAS